MLMVLIFILMALFFLIGTASTIYSDTATEEELVNAGVSLSYESMNKPLVIEYQLLSDPNNLELIHFNERFYVN